MTLSIASIHIVFKILHCSFNFVVVRFVAHIYDYVPVFQSNHPCVGIDMQSKAPVPCLIRLPKTMLALGLERGSKRLCNAASTINTEVDSKLIWSSVELISAMPILFIGLYPSEKAFYGSDYLLPV